MEAFNGSFQTLTFKIHGGFKGFHNQIEIQVRIINDSIKKSKISHKLIDF
jgi:hypothetical protein